MSYSGNFLSGSKLPVTNRFRPSRTALFVRWFLKLAEDS